MLIVEDRSSVPENIPALLVPNGRRAISQLAACCYGYPTRKLKTFGITGTNGKTTSLWLLSEALTRFGERVLSMGTLGIGFEGDVFSKGETTTPTAQDIHKSASKGLSLGATACVMEVSSHALKQWRADDVEFDAALFTNLTPDHLDYHQSLESYFSSKKRLFELANKYDAPLATGIIDEYGVEMFTCAKTFSEKAVSFGESAEATFQMNDLEMSPEGLAFSVIHDGTTYPVSSQLIGKYNGHNLLGVFSVLCSVGYEPGQVVDVLQSIPAPPGRMERFYTNHASVFVDYAHAPDALRNALSALRPVTKGNLWVLFGCGGDKDPRRRVGMGKAAKELADKIVVTSDNPRSESPMQIIEDILETGLRAEFVEVDRRVAIQRALGELKEGDVLLVAGKGHEDYQIIGEEVSYFSDQDEVRKAIANI